MVPPPGRTLPKRNLRARAGEGTTPNMQCGRQEQQIHTFFSFPVRSAASATSAPMHRASDHALSPLAFGELEPLARALLAVLLPLVLPGIAREKAELLQLPA